MQKVALMAVEMLMDLVLVNQEMEAEEPLMLELALILYMLE